jgi:hypothetical protein
MERMGKEQIVAQSEVLFWSLYEAREKHNEIVRTLLSRLIFKQVRPEHKSITACAIVLGLLQIFIQIEYLPYHL